MTNLKAHIASASDIIARNANDSYCWCAWGSPIATALSMASLSKL